MTFEGEQWERKERPKEHVEGEESENNTSPLSTMCLLPSSRHFRRPKRQELCLHHTLPSHCLKKCSGRLRIHCTKWGCSLLTTTPDWGSLGNKSGRLSTTCVSPPSFPSPPLWAWAQAAHQTSRAFTCSYTLSLTNFLTLSPTSTPLLHPWPRMTALSACSCPLPCHWRCMQGCLLNVRCYLFWAPVLIC
jgi:hypothetical protein